MVANDYEEDTEMPDQEIGALSAVADALGNLDQDARTRVIEWTVRRFDLTLGSGPSGGGEKRLDGGGGSPATGGAVDSEGLNVAGYDSLAELFDAAQPKTEADRALVGAYWITSSSGQQDFQAQPLNTQLKDLGYALGNVTDALSTLKDRKPALVLQMKKDGTSRQARKTYRLTMAGKKQVRTMLAEPSDGDG